MTQEQSAAYVVAQSVYTLVEAMGMQAENQVRISQNCAPAYDEKAFVDLLNRSQIGHNDVVGLFNRLQVFGD